MKNDPLPISIHAKRKPSRKINTITKPSPSHFVSMPKRSRLCPESKQPRHRRRSEERARTGLAATGAITPIGAARMLLPIPLSGAA